MGPGTLNPGHSVRPNTLAAGQIRPLVDGNRGIDITRFTQPDQNRQTEKLQLTRPAQRLVLDGRAGSKDLVAQSH